MLAAAMGIAGLATTGKLIYVAASSYATRVGVPGGAVAPQADETSVVKFKLLPRVSTGAPRAAPGGDVARSMILAGVRPSRSPGAQSFLSGVFERRPLPAAAEAVPATEVQAVPGVPRVLLAPAWVGFVAKDAIRLLACFVEGSRMVAGPELTEAVRHAVQATRHVHAAGAALFILRNGHPPRSGAPDIAPEIERASAACATSGTATLFLVREAISAVRETHETVAAVCGHRPEFDGDDGGDALDEVREWVRGEMAKEGRADPTPRERAMLDNPEAAVRTGATNRARVTWSGVPVPSNPFAARAVGAMDMWARDIEEDSFRVVISAIPGGPIGVSARRPPGVYQTRAPKA